VSDITRRLGIIIENPITATRATITKSFDKVLHKELLFVLRHIHNQHGTVFVLAMNENAKC